MATCWNKLRLRLALWLLSGMPANVWLGRHQGPYTGGVAWQAGRLDSRGVLQGCALDTVFDHQAADA